MKHENFPTAVTNSRSSGPGDHLVDRLVARGVSVDRVAMICSWIDTKIYTAPVMSEIEHEFEVALARYSNE